MHKKYSYYEKLSSINFDEKLKRETCQMVLRKLNALARLVLCIIIAK